ncbi:MAG TPA: hypothetical protein VK988_11980 [Acidimicrobiales bacterium]|nr:hypothetical protein [Acidimicrobiales bacterium]
MAFNKAETIADAVASLAQVVDALSWFDTGSADQTVQRAEESGATLVERLSIISRRNAIGDPIPAVNLQHKWSVTVDADEWFKP